MSRRKSNKKTSFVRFLGLLFMPLVAGGALGAYFAFCMYSNYINGIDNSVLSEVEIEYGHPITVDSFFTRVPANTTFITNVGLIDTGKLATYEIFFDCGGNVARRLHNCCVFSASARCAQLLYQRCCDRCRSVCCFLERDHQSLSHLCSARH